MTDPLEARLREISEAYGRQIPERVHEVRETWGEVRERGNPTAAMSDLKRLVHSLKGGGRTFGYPELSDCARRLEESLTELAKAGPEPATVARLDELLDTLEQVVALDSLHI